ncbi:MAG: hypothetical protein DLM57_18205 [Pseudonocardiales bacterium]|nr:MAG: hypothetical protein DLM57_18205 [Pseudonocardiales bacterium]
MGSLSLSGIERELRHLLAQIQDLDLWPPWDAVRTVVEFFGEVMHIAFEPPDPDPAIVLDCAGQWWNVSLAVDFAEGDVDACRTAMVPAVWQGEAGDAARSSMQAFSRRTGTVAQATSSINSALQDLAVAMKAARSRHSRAYGELNPTVDFGFHLNPVGYLHDLEHAIENFVRGVEDLIGAYSDAATAVQTGQEKIEAACESIALPAAIGANEGAISTIDGWTGGQQGPLRGTVLARANARIAAMSAADRARVNGLLGAAPNDQARAWILAAVGSGANLDTLDRFAARIDTLSPTQLTALDPTTGTSYTEGSDDTTCGSDALVVAKMINNPVYALSIVDGYDATTGATMPTPNPTDTDPIHARFVAAANAMHDQTNSVLSHTGTPQVPWPQPWGTLPGAVANAMDGPDGAGVPGTSYQGHLIDPYSLGSEYDSIGTTVSHGEAVPLFVGDGHSPRHIVLVTSTTGDTMTAYDPSRGQTYSFSRSDFVTNHLDLGGWTQAWLSVTPS